MKDRFFKTILLALDQEDLFRANKLVSLLGVKSRLGAIRQAIKIVYDQRTKTK